MKEYTNDFEWKRYPKSISPLEADALRYGTYLTDDQMECGYDCDSPFYVRIRTIKYEGKLYYHKMVDGEVVEFKELI